MNITNLIIGAALTMGASYGLALVAARRGRKLASKMLSRLPQESGSSVAEIFNPEHYKRDHLPELLARRLRSALNAGESAKKNAAAMNAVALDPATAEKLKETLSAKPSVDAEVETHPYSGALQNTGSFRPTGAGGGAV